AVGPTWRRRGEVGHVPLIVEARHLVVRLRFKIGTEHAAACHGVEEWHAGLGHEVMHERGDKDGLAGSREPGDAEPYRWLDQVRRKVADIAKCVGGAVGEGRDRHAFFDRPSSLAWQKMLPKSWGVEAFTPSPCVG